MKHIRKRATFFGAVVMLSLIVQPFCGDTIQAEEEWVYCTKYDVCRERQIGELYFHNIKIWWNGDQTQFVCDVTNLSEYHTASEGDYVAIAFYKDGEEMISLFGFFPNIPPGETRVIRSSAQDLDLTEADFMSIGSYGKKESYEIISIEEEKFKQSRFIENVLILNHFELHKVRQDCWRFKGGATALKEMYVPYKITFTFTGEDSRTEQYSTEIQLDQNFSTEYRVDFGDMSWVKDMEVSYEKGTAETIILETDDVEEMIPDAAVKFTGFEITENNGEEYWNVKPRCVYIDARYQIFQVYYEILDKDENVLMTCSQNIYNQYGTVPELPSVQTDAHMERAVRARAYFRTRPFYPSEKNPKAEATDPPKESPQTDVTDLPQESPKQDPGSEPMGQSSNPQEQPQDRTMSTAESLHSSIRAKEEKVGAVSIKIGKSTTGLPVLTLKGRGFSGKYEIYRSTKKGSGYKKIAESSSSRYIDKGVKGGNIYYYRVRQVIWVDGKIKPGPFTKGVRAIVSGQNIPQFQIQSKRYSVKLNYAEIRLKRYQGDYVQIFYRKSGGKFKSIKLKQNRISKKKNIFRISYERRISALYIRVRTYRIENGRKQYSDFSKTIKVKRNGKISVVKDVAS